MLAKASLHIHTSEDKIDGKFIAYSTYELIDRAAANGFNILAITPHKKYIFEEAQRRYAKTKNILLIPGIEIEIHSLLILRHHLILLNVEPEEKNEAEKIQNYSQLKYFKQKYPGVFILAAHPNFGRFESMGWKNLEKNIDLFDAVELCWFYTDRFNLNRKSLAIAKKYNKPIIATSDLHTYDYFTTDYCHINCANLVISDVTESLRQGNITNHSHPKNFFVMMRIFLKMEIGSCLKYFL